MSSPIPDHSSVVEQFCGITGADDTRAKYYLEACNWNLELAINMHVDTDDSARRATTNNSLSNANLAGPSNDDSPLLPILEQDESNNQAPHRYRNMDNNSRPRRFGPSSSEEVRPPIPPVRQILVQQPIGYGPGEIRRHNTRLRTQTDIFDPFRDFQAEAQWQESAQSEAESNSDETESFAAQTSRPRNLQECFRPPLDLMFRGSLGSAREAGTVKNKWILVDVQNNNELSCLNLNRDLWTNPTVKDIVKAHFIFWKVYHDSSEGTKFVQFYHVTRFPHVSIIDPRTGELVKSWPASIDHNSFCDSVLQFVCDQPTPDGTVDTSSLQKDEASESSDMGDDESPKMSESPVKQLETNNDSPKMMEESSTSSPAKKEEPPQMEVDIESYEQYLGKDTDHLAEIMIRFPDGTSDKFKFPCDSKMKALFLFLTSKGYGLKEYNYVTTYPRRLISTVPSNETLQEHNLSRCQIIVERKKEDD